MLQINSWIMVKVPFYGRLMPQMTKIEIVPKSLLQIRGRVRGGYKCAMVSRSGKSYCFIVDCDTFARCCVDANVEDSDNSKSVQNSVLNNLQFYDFI